MTNSLKNYISCPHCGAQYTPDELFVRGEMLGKSKNVIKDALGKILYVEYADESDEPNFVTSYICDNCNKSFVVEASMSFKSKKEDSITDFTNSSVSLLD